VEVAEFVRRGRFAVRAFSLSGPRQGRLSVLALGAHADDIEIGCGGTLLRLASEHPALDVTWVVFSSTEDRAAEARTSAEAFLAEASRRSIVVKAHRDGYLPYSGVQLKDDFEALKSTLDPDLILTHFRDDRHQDHRVVSDLTWNTWRNHLIWEYEIPKFDGDFGVPNLFAPLSSGILEKKVQLILRAFPTQMHKPWFNADLFRAVARLRGMECVAPEAYAEAFYCRKAVL
jgi:LmbE family N-acetylglucosaminyl deacetylase